MLDLTNLIHQLLGLYKIILIASVILFWLVRYNLLDIRNEVVRNISNFLTRVTEPVLGPIRRALPDMGGIDISPIVVIIAIQILQNMLVR
jgi:YggT family protein